MPVFVAYYLLAVVVLLAVGHLDVAVEAVVV